MASDTKNVKMGVCLVYYKGIDLGYTQGGVQVTVTTQTHKTNVDQFGKTTVNEQIMSRDVSVKVPLAETTLENLVATMPGATIVGTGTDKKAIVTSGVGVSLLDLAGELRLHPKGRAVDDYSEDFVIPLAATSGGLSFAYEVEKERIFDTTFTGYPDPATEELFAIGGAPVVAP
ncbi:hypothetical protein SB778_03575 [Paraburkholderia sp. SIMBA_050]